MINAKKRHNDGVCGSKPTVCRTLSSNIQFRLVAFLHKSSMTQCLNREHVACCRIKFDFYSVAWSCFFFLNCTFIVTRCGDGVHAKSHKTNGIFVAWRLRLSSWLGCALCFEALANEICLVDYCLVNRWVFWGRIELFFLSFSGDLRVSSWITPNTSVWVGQCYWWHRPIRRKWFLSVC